MTSTHFFRQSLFHYEDETHPQPLTDHHVLTPWTSHQALPTQASKRQSRKGEQLQPSPQKQPEIPKRSSNLLPERRLPAKDMELLPPLPKAEPTAKKLKSELKLRGMPIQQFLSQKREERAMEEMLHKKSMALINQSLESSFLARRNLRKRSSLGCSNTIDLNRDLYQPMQIYRSQQVVEITPDKFARRRDIGSLSKYLPIRSQRYQN